MADSPEAWLPDPPKPPPELPKPTAEVPPVTDRAVGTAVFPCSRTEKAPLQRVAGAEPT
jgi:hypothetical protein